MKFKSITIILCLFIGIVSSCKQELTKVVEEKYPDGSPQLERYYKEKGDKKELVKEIIYWSSKKKKIEGTYKNTQREGHWMAWFENGNPWSEGYYINGIEDGPKNVWHESGKIMYSGQYKLGKKVGTWKFYDEKGVLATEKDYDKIDFQDSISK